ncbi:60Kd inner membrane protein-domain-containing protein [Xylariomycetidae sp. FL2044]|nr:60Kd inner membrane protein-domain-containing protein [Xylariomycetidae sp. FL2044]
MSSEEPHPLAESGVTMHSDSEQYSAGEDLSTSPPSSASSPMILYKPPTVWSMVRGAAINLLLPFINGMMLGFGELFAHEAAFRLGWGGTRPIRSSQIPSRHFSQLQRSVPSPRLANIRSGGSLGVAAGVFAQRNGASRNLSLWPFGSKQQPQSPAETATPAPAEPTPESWTSTTETRTSTVSNPSTDGTLQTSSAANPADVTSQGSTDAFSDLDLMSVLDIPERIGYLKDLGLDFGWGPTACCEWVLEHAYISTGMPWWACLAFVAFAWRVVFFVPQMHGAKHTALMQKAQSKPEFRKAQQEFQDAAFRTKDQMAMLRARATMKSITQAEGASFWLPFIGFAMIPFNFGMFRLLRAMATVPVPSLENGGLFWFTDLTVADPYFILPVCSIALTLLGFRQTMSANMKKSTPQMEAFTKALPWVLPPFVFLGTCWLPAALQWFFLVFAMSHLVQSTATINPGVRRYFQLPELQANAPVSDATKTLQGPMARPGPSTVAGLRKSVDTMTESLQKTMGHDKASVQQTKAQNYEKRRAQEEKEKAAQRLEDLRRRQGRKAPKP